MKLQQAVLAVMLGATVASAEIVHVETIGNDSPTCGSESTPCRTIRFGITRAAPTGDVIVGPGTYGDVDGDGDFDDAGEEAAEVDSGCTCVIQIAWHVRVLSSDGAAATTITAGPRSIALVEIAANGATLGGPDAGFTLDRGQIAVDVRPGTRNVRVRDNVAHDQRGVAFAIRGMDHIVERNFSARANIAFKLEGDGHSLFGNEASAPRFRVFGMRADGDSNRIADNRMVDGELVTFGSGHEISGNTFERGSISAYGDRLTVAGNSVADGYLWVSGADLDVIDNVVERGRYGFIVDGVETSVLRNDVSGTEWGVQISGRAVTADGNRSHDNLGDGFEVSGRHHVLRRNVSERNGGTGFALARTVETNSLFANRIRENADGGVLNDGSGNVRIANNDIRDNDLAGVINAGRGAVRMTRNDLQGNDSTRNCGVRTLRDSSTDARGNWWGSERGPGRDPADDVCGAGRTVAVPYATEPFRPPQ
jgi:nitrous oxidase accessory protein NosD